MLYTNTIFQLCGTSDINILQQVLVAHSQCFTVPCHLIQIVSSAFTTLLTDWLEAQ